jgi:RNA polymerase sigma-54 factor
MTTQMKQAIEVLQCSAEELQAYIEEHIADNPFAELEFPSPSPLESWGLGRAPSASRGRSRSDAEGLPLENIVRSEPTLIEQLEHQIDMCQERKEVLKAAKFIIGCLDESGYLIESDATLAELLGMSEAIVREAIGLVQSLEPPGIGARSLKECLLLQLSSVPGHLRDVVRELIDNHLEDIADGKIRNISRRMKLPAHTIQEAVDALRRLNPRPGLCYRMGQPEYVIPDVVVERVGTGYIVLTNDYSTPTVRLCEENRKMLMGMCGEEAREFVQKKFHAAKWIVRCIEQRRLTLYRVAEAILNFQRDFFDYGYAHIKPLTLRQVADHIGLHESTISRATRNKYMQTPRGVFEMRFFFTSELQGQHGTTSAEAAKHQIKRLIEGEDPKKPLSDDALSRELIRAGIHISRRTVAKYREEMGIPASARRKRFA